MRMRSPSCEFPVVGIRRDLMYQGEKDNELSPSDLMTKVCVLFSQWTTMRNKDVLTQAKIYLAAGLSKSNCIYGNEERLGLRKENL